MAMPSEKRRGIDDKPVLGADGKVVWDACVDFRNAGEPTP
jgi:hypothetical protein